MIDTRSVKNTATAARTVGFDGGRLIKVRKRVLIVDTIGHLLWTEVHPANVADGKTGVAVWSRAEYQNACWTIWCYFMQLVRLVVTSSGS